MAKASFLVAKAEREISTGLPKVKVVVGSKEKAEKDNDAKVAAMTGLAVVGSQKAVGAVAGAGGRALWQTGRKKFGDYMLKRKVKP